jgi:hypothetical protein
MEVVISTCYGGFSLSDEAVLLYAEKAGIKLYPRERNIRETDFYTVPPEYFSDRDIERDDPNLVEVVKELGNKANGEYASLSVINIPDDVDWTIEEYDGSEWISEEHRTWR